MTIIALADCCRLLAIDPKTLRGFLSLARLPVQPHPLDTRLKCVTHEQLQQVAAAHHRSLPESSEPPFQAETSAPSTSEDVRRASVLSSVMSDVSVPITELTQQLGSLQAHVATLQHQLALLTEQLHKEQQWRTSHVSTFEDQSLESSLDTESAPASIDRRKHPHVLPLVEYGVQGKYVVISPQRGMLSFQPDSPQWFAWLETLPSFRFVGQFGRLTAHRGYQCSPATPWRAHRQIRNHSYNHRLGTTEGLTIAVLEQAAAALQSHMN